MKKSLLIAALLIFASTASAIDYTVGDNGIVKVVENWTLDGGCQVTISGVNQSVEIVEVSSSQLKKLRFADENPLPAVDTSNLFLSFRENNTLLVRGEGVMYPAEKSGFNIRMSGGKTWIVPTNGAITLQTPCYPAKCQKRI